MARKPAARKKNGEGRAGNTHAHLGGAGLTGRDGSEGATGGSRGVIGEPEGGRGGVNAKETSGEEKRTVRRGRVDREIAEMGKSRVQAVAEEKEENGNSTREARCRKRAAARADSPRKATKKGAGGGGGAFGRE